MFLGCRYLMFVDALVCVNVVLWLDKICVGHITLEWYFVLYSLWTEAYRFYLSITNERELFFFRDENMTNILCPTSFLIRRPKSNLFLFYLTAKVMIKDYDDYIDDNKPMILLEIFISKLLHVTENNEGNSPCRILQVHFCSFDK